MKNKFFYVLLFSVFLSKNAFSQENTSSISVFGGYAGKSSLGFALAYDYGKNQSTYEVALMHFMFKDEKYDESVNYSNSNLQLGYFHNILRNRNNSILFLLGGGVFGGMESIQSKENVIIEQKSKYVAGVFLGATLDFYISDNTSIILRGQENYNVISSSGKMNPLASIGIKFNL